VLEIEDGGQGAGAPGASRGSFPLGVGLAGMRERVRQVGGTFTVEALASGTIVRATLPRTRTQQ
jgi:signal transduction histidine kinase